MNDEEIKAIVANAMKAIDTFAFRCGRSDGHLNDLRVNLSKALHHARFGEPKLAMKFMNEASHINAVHLQLNWQYIGVKRVAWIAFKNTRRAVLTLRDNH